MKKSIFYFLCILGVYTLILLILAGLFLGYADRSLKKFEKSQSTYAMDKYVEDFEKKLSAGTLPEGFASENASAFESADVTLSNLQTAAAGKTISYEKDPGSYNTEEPVYDLLANGQEFAKVTLSATNSRVVFAILTIMDWDVKKAELTNVESGTVYTVSAPADYKVMVNGVEVGSEYLTGKSVSLPLFANAKEYLNIPEIVEYKLPPLNNDPVVTALNEAGEEAFVSREGNAINVSFGRATAMPEDLEATALEIAKTWSLFMTADLRGSKYGLDTVRQYLIPDSFYDGLAKDWAGGIDITFTSAHTLKSNPFENVEVSNYVRYTDDCFSCHISFDKPMHLTRTGEDIVDSTHSTYLFVKNNGQWCLVDMVADTDNPDENS